MKRRDKIQRIEYLSELERGAKSLLASNSIEATKLANLTTAQKYSLQNPNDLRQLLFSINTELDNATTTIYSQVLEQNGRMAEMGINHSSSNIRQDVKVDFFKTMGTGSTIASRNATRVLADGKQLSERIWTSEQRSKIYKLVGESVRAGENPFQLAQKIESYVGEKFPRYMIDRIANTELIQSYTDGKKETYGAFLDDYEDEFKVVVDIELSPFHPFPDICDVLEGTYEFGTAPDIPHHPNCICSRTERIVPVERKVNTKTAQEYIDERSKLIEDKNIYMPKEAGGLVL